jgi:hypothetical protein
MNLFRSEEHLDGWLDGRPAGATLSVTKLSDLAHVWWSDRLDPAWQPRNRLANQALLTQLGLVDDFWALP